MSFVESNVLYAARMNKMGQAAALHTKRSLQGAEKAEKKLTHAVRCSKANTLPYRKIK